MPTAPRAPAGDATLSPTDIDRILRSVGEGPVLVGGQALAFWMDRYGLAPRGGAITHDADLLGSAQDAQALALALRARLLLPDPERLTSLVAQIRLPAPDGQARNIDTLHLLYTIDGLRKSRTFTARVWRQAVRMRLADGSTLRVMAPLDVLESRAHNAVGLFEDKGPHVLTQLRWAMEVARIALDRLSGTRDGEADHHLGQALRRLHGLAASRVGRTLWTRHGVELLEVVVDRSLRRRCPACAPQLDRIRTLRAVRADR